jgi:hypothetical protein
MIHGIVPGTIRIGHTTGTLLVSAITPDQIMAMDGAECITTGIVHTMPEIIISGMDQALATGQIGIGTIIVQR